MTSWNKLAILFKASSSRSKSPCGSDTLVDILSDGQSSCASNGSFDIEALDSDTLSTTALYHGPRNLHGSQMSSAASITLNGDDSDSDGYNEDDVHYDQYEDWPQLRPQSQDGQQTQDGEGGEQSTAEEPPIPVTALRPPPWYRAQRRPLVVHDTDAPSGHAPDTQSVNGSVHSSAARWPDTKHIGDNTAKHLF